MSKRLAIVGAGRVGREIGRRLRLLGWRIGTVVTRRCASGRSAVRWIGAGSAQRKVTAECLAADLVLIAVPDRAIASVVGELSQAVGATRWVARANRGEARLDVAKSPAANRASRRLAPTVGARPVVLHTSGSLSHEVLAPLARIGAAIGAMHPMQTFGRNARPDFGGTVFGIDGEARAVRLARQIATALGGTPVVIDARKKAAYHCAGGFAAQHVLAVLETGVRLLTDVGLTRAQAVRSLCNMAHQTLTNLEERGPSAAWSGPVARGDFATVAKHIEALQAYPRDFRDAYDSLTRLVIQLVAKDPRVLKKYASAARR